MGKKLTDLQAANQLAEVATGAETCPQNTTARGTGVWTDVRLSFRPDGKLYMAVNRSTDDTDAVGCLARHDADAAQDDLRRHPG